MHYMHAELPINPIKFNQIYLNYSSKHSSNKLIEKNSERPDNIPNYASNSQNHDKTIEYKTVDYKPLLNRRQHRTKNLRKETDFHQSNKIYLKKFKSLKNKNNDNTFMKENDLSPHQVFTGLYEEVDDATGENVRVESDRESNYFDNRSSKKNNLGLKKRTNKRNTGSLANLFYQYTALMQTQLLLPALFIRNNTRLSPASLSLSHDALLTNGLSTKNSSLKTDLLDYELSSSFSRQPQVALLISSTNQPAYELPSYELPSFSTSDNTISSGVNQLLVSPINQKEWFNVSDAYSDYDRNFNTNSSNFTLLPSFELLNLNLLLTILISFLMVVCILVTAIGNLFVIAAILRDRILRNVQNYLVFSLAFADLMVSLLVMPLAAVYEIQGHWTLGVILCDIWTWADVLCCTASILHLLAIAIDRYWAVTSVEYMRSRNARKILGLIALVWFVALLVSVGPLLGWKDSNFEKRLNEEGVCSYSQDLSYQLFATVSTFYAPLIFILLLYWRIFQVARKRLRNKPGNNQLLKSGRNDSTKTSAVQSYALQSNGSMPNEDSTSSCSRTNSKYCKSNVNEDQKEAIEPSQLANKRTGSQQKQLQSYARFQDTNNNPLMQSTTDLSSNNSPATTIIELHSSTNTPMHLIDHTNFNQNGDIQTNNMQPNCQAELLPMKQLTSGKAFSVVVADNDLKTTTTLILAKESPAQFNIDEQLSVTCNGSGEDSKNSTQRIKSSTKQTNQSNISKEMAARLKQKQQQDSKRERKTARILAIITGVFVICWLPFFVLTLLKALIPKYRDYTLLFSIFLWLGYTNSSINPAIYTIFSPDFRSAFKKLIKGRRQS